MRSKFDDTIDNAFQEDKIVLEDHTVSVVERVAFSITGIQKGETL